MMVKESEIKKFFNSFYKCIKNKKMYIKTRTLFDKFLDETYNILKNYVKNYGPLILNIEETSVTVEGKSIHEDKNKMTSLPLYFYRNGIRSITFLEWIEKKEIEKFIDIVSEHDFATHMNLSEDLWIENFTNIIFYVVEEPPKDYFEMIENNTEINKFDFSLKKIGSSPFMDFEKIEEKKDLSKITNILNSEKSESILNVILNIYELESDPQKKQEVLSFIKDFANYSIQEGDILELFTLLDFSKRCSIPKEFFEDVVYSDNAIELYLNYVVDREKRNAISKLLIGGGKKVLPHIKEFIKNVDSVELFVYFRNIIIDICKRDKDAIGLMFPSPRQFIPYILEVIQEIKEKSYIEYVLSLFKIEEVKTLAIKTFVEISPRSDIIKLINDNDKTIRITILKNIKSIENEDEFKKFKDRIEDKKFWILKQEERENLIRIISTYNKNEVLPIFDKMLSKVSFKKDVNSTKVYIINILKKMGGEGRNLLLKYKNSFRLKKIIKEVLKEYGNN